MPYFLAGAAGVGRRRGRPGARGPLDAATLPRRPGTTCNKKTARQFKTKGQTIQNDSKPEKIKAKQFKTKTIQGQILAMA